MGCSQAVQSEREWLDELERLESVIYDKCGIPREKIQKKNVTFQHDFLPEGELMTIHTVILGSSDFDSDAVHLKPTFVLMHGFAGAAATMFPIYRALMEHYRLVVIDMLGFGGSSRVQEMPIEAFASVEAMDELTIDWFAKWVEQMDADDDLPPKFYLSGHSWGGYMTGLYAGRYPERIAALFMNSPIGPEALPENYDIYNLRHKNNEYEPSYAKAIDYWCGKWEQLDTPLSAMRSFPHWIQKLLISQGMAIELEGFSDEDQRMVVEYWWHMAHIASDSEKALPFCFHFGVYAKHPLTREDRLGNKNLDFPIGICFGEQDWLGSSGADYIVKNNKYFDEGLSQLFVIPNSDHLTYCDNPEELARIMIGFLNQTIKHTFQEKPRQAYITQRTPIQRCQLESTDHFLEEGKDDNQAVHSRKYFFDKHELKAYENTRKLGRSFVKSTPFDVRDFDEFDDSTTEERSDVQSPSKQQRKFKGMKNPDDDWEKGSDIRMDLTKPSKAKADAAEWVELDASEIEEALASYHARTAEEQADLKFFRQYVE